MHIYYHERVFFAHLTTSYSSTDCSCSTCSLRSVVLASRSLSLSRSFSFSASDCFLVLSARRPRRTRAMLVHLPMALAIRLLTMSKHLQNSRGSYVFFWLLIVKRKSLLFAYTAKKILFFLDEIIMMILLHTCAASTMRSHKTHLSSNARCVATSLGSMDLLKDTH